jgi:hypothetical protein
MEKIIFWNAGKFFQNTYTLQKDKIKIHFTIHVMCFLFVIIIYDSFVQLNAR